MPLSLVAGVKTILVITQHVTKTGDPKILRECTYPLTGKGVVDRIYTDLAVIDVTDEGLVVTELAPGVSFDSVCALTDAPLTAGPGLASEVHTG